MPDEPKPDLAAGIAVSEIPEGGMLAGRVGDEAVLLVRDGDDVRAFDGTCSHLGAPLEQGVVLDGAIRCPWHHACFDRQSGEALRPPAFDSLRRWTVLRDGDRIRVTAPVTNEIVAHRSFAGHSEPGFVIVGGGAAGYAAVHELRRCGHEGQITLVSADADLPYDRTLLTKDYLEGRFGEDRLPIARTTLDDLGVTVLPGTLATSLDPHSRLLHLADGHSLPYTSLLLATGAEPKRLDAPGTDLPHVHYLRTLSDCRALIGACQAGLRVVVIGGSFIGLETAAALTARGLRVTVITPDALPMEKILGAALARAILSVQTAHGVVFRTGAEVTAITTEAVQLADGSAVPAEIVVVGIGVAPRVDLARSAGLAVEDGVLVDRFLRTSAPDIYAAGDIARWPDPHSGQSIRVEHWVVAERHGQVAARNMLGGTEPFEAVPFFWSKHFDFSFRYLGHAEHWDDVAIEGDLDDRDATIRYRTGDRDMAAATVERDVEALRIEYAMETG